MHYIYYLKRESVNILTLFVIFTLSNKIVSFFAKEPGVDGSLKYPHIVFIIVISMLIRFFIEYYYQENYNS